MTFKQWLMLQEKCSIKSKDISDKMDRLRIGGKDRKGPQWAPRPEVFHSKKQ